MSLTSIGHYRLDELIGLGGMGEVFRAFDTKLNRPVAVKVMRNTGNAPGVQRFLREARAASALNHPNIVIIHEIGETDTGDQFIVQELIAGRTLRSMLEAPLPIATIADVGGQIAQALAAAHAAGIVHRDIKPENIMIRGDGYVKVLDFGLARMVEVDTAATQITHTSLNTDPGTLLGTPSYMSPEQASGRRTGPPGDVFALGVVLYEMAGGRRPFVAPSSIGVITSILTEEPVPLARVNPEIPRALDDLIRRMLDKDPYRRPSASDVQGELATPMGVVHVPAPTAASRTTVGRDAQRAQLWRAYGRVKEGKSLIVAVTGEPGIGKTSLIEEFLAELSKGGERPTLARGRCSERLAGAEAYLPILDALDSLIHRHAGPSLAGVLKAVAPTWYQQVATHSPEPTAIVADLREATGAASQERMKRELGALLMDLSRTQPVVVFIDDLHWADVSTIDMLNYLSGRFADMHVLVLASYRPSEMALARHPFLAIRGDLQSRGLFEEVGLNFLEQADVERYLALQFPGHRFPNDFGAAIHAKTEGSPLFMADLVRYLHDTGGIVEEHGTWALAHALPDAPRELPASVRGMIQRKIDQVEERDLKLLLAASVQGHWFDSTIVGEAVEMDPADVEERLDALEHVHVLVRRGDESEFRDRTLTLNYQFVHVLYQNVLYASLQPTRRATISGRVARALVAHHGDQIGNVAGRVAVLFEAARDFSAASTYFNLAARRSFELLAFREALSLAERGLHALHGLPEGPVRQQQEVALQMTRGTALRSTSGWATAEIEGVFTRARQLCAELGDPPELLPVLWATTLFLMIRGNLSECRDRADKLMTLANASGEQAYIMVAHHVGGVVREFIGDVVESNRLLERCRELHVPAKHLTYVAMFGQDPGMTARAMSSRPWWVLGYPDRALERARETLEIARSQRQPLSLAFALVVIQGIHLYRGEAAAAMAMGDKILAVCREYELPQEAEWSRGFQGFALHLLGQTADGIEVLKGSLAAQRLMGSGLVRPAFLALLAEALWRAGRIDEGLSAIDEGFEHAERTSEGGYVAELHRVRGELLHASGNAAQAEDSLREALAYAGRQQAKSLELRAATSLARLLHSARRTDDARAILAPVYEWFTEGNETADLVGARTLLSQME